MACIFLFIVFSKFLGLGEIMRELNCIVKLLLGVVLSIIFLFFLFYFGFFPNSFLFKKKAKQPNENYCITEKESVVVPYEYNYIKSCMFQNNECIKEIRFLNPNTEIAPTAFSNCKSLNFVSLPRELKKIAPYTFAFCKKLSLINIPENVETIACGAFVECSNLKEIVLPKKIKELGDNVFVGCDTLLLIELQCKKGEELIKFDNYENWGMSDCCKIKFKDSSEEELKKYVEKNEK